MKRFRRYDLQPAPPPSNLGSRVEGSTAVGRIFEDVFWGHLREYPDEKPIISAFQGDYDVTWGKRRSAYGSEFSTYILRPEKDVRDIFGLGMEVALFLFDYPSLEPRTIQAINNALNDEPLKGRVEPAAYFLLSRDPQAKSWVSEYLMRTAQIRTPITLSFDEVRSAQANKYKLRDTIAAFAFRRDLFDYKLPIDNDIYFFGREATVSELVDQIKKGQNTGIFGLRKTGKTSLLYKVARMIEGNGTARAEYIDCKNPIIRKKSAEGLALHIASKLAESHSIPRSRFQALSPYEALDSVIHHATRRANLCLIFDEIEYISPLSLTDPHWTIDFIDFWQFLWSTQSKSGKLSFIVCGVNGTVCETDTYSKVQNPLFGIVKSTYIQGLESSSLRRMVQHFGGQMGLRFSDGAVRELEKHYGGHPLLTRMACSFIHKKLEREKKGRPIDLSDRVVAQALAYCDQEIASYCAHVTSELRDFYPDEYDVLKMAALGLKSDFAEFGRDQDLSRHLRSYGVVRDGPHGLPEISLPVLRNFLRSEHIRQNGGKIPRELVSRERRPWWVADIVQRILDDLRTTIQTMPNTISTPFGGRGIPDSDLLIKTEPVASKDDFQNFVTRFYKVMYENVVQRGYIAPGAFRTSFANDWPKLQIAIDRIKRYRDYTLHLDVSESTREAYEDFLRIDLGDSKPEEIEDGWFALQQATLDELLYAVQAEAAAKCK